MRSFRWALAALLVWCASSEAQTQLPLIGVGGIGVAYSGPADAATVTPTAWWSCTRGMSAAVSNGTTQACALRRGSDSTTCTALIASTGLVDYLDDQPCAGQTVLAWMTRSVVRGTIATTTLTTTGDPCKAAVGDQIIGSGITGVTTISTVTSCALGTGSYVISASYTISVAEPIIDLIPTFVSTAYDQTQGNLCGGGSCDLVQATTSHQPSLLMNCINNGTLPCLSSLTAAVILTSAHTFTPNAALQASLSAVANRQSGTAQTFIVEENGGQNNMLGKSAAANTWALTAGGVARVSPTANDGVLHSVNAVMQAGTSADIANIDGTETTGTGTPTATAFAPQAFGGGAATVLNEAEAGFWDNVIFTQTQRTNVCGNQAAFYGTTIGTHC